MMHVLGKYRTIATINMRTRFAYLASMLSELAILSFRFVIAVYFYEATYASTNELFDQLTLQELLWCVTLVRCFESSATEPSVSEIIEDDVRSGSLAYAIIKPYSYIFFQYCAFLGRMVANLSFFLPVSVVLMVYFAGVPTLSVQSVILSLVLLLLGQTLNFFIELAIGLLAFWIEDVKSISWAYHTLTLILGGVIIPLAVLPDWFAEIASYLPFRQLFYSAARLMVRFDSDLSISFFTMQLVWLTFVSVMMYYLWRKGSKHVSLGGG